MFTKKSSSTLETVFQDTYASASRANEANQNRLSSVINDFSLADESVGEFDDTITAPYAYDPKTKLVVWIGGAISAWAIMIVLAYLVYLIF